MEDHIFKQLMDAELYSCPGCGESKAIAFSAATVRTYAPGEIKCLYVEASPLLAIGVQTIILPKTDSKRGGLFASAIGLAVGNAEAGLDVLSAAKETDIKTAENLIASGKIIFTMKSDVPDIYLKARLETEEHTATVILQDGYNTIKYIEQDGAVLLDKGNELQIKPRDSLKWSNLSVDAIYEYCANCDIGELERFRQLIDITHEIIKDGLRNPYGLQVGRTLQEGIQRGVVGDNEFAQILLWTVAGIDARMNGSKCSTAGNTGSASQGHIICAAPIAAGNYLKSSEESVLRAVAMTNLLNIYMDYKTSEYSHLSPMCYCGSIGVAAAVAGVAYLHCLSRSQITDIIRTVLCTLPGIICDGASKSICALRVYTGMSGALQAMLIAEKGLSIKEYEGFASESVDTILDNLYRLQKECLSNVNDLLYDLKKKQGTFC